MAYVPGETLTPDLTDAARLGIAALVGLAVGIERQWSGHASGPHAHFAGMRTFLLLGLLGGSAGLLIAWEFATVGAVVLGGGSVFVAVAYFMTVRREGDDVDGTTEVAALVVLALGAVAGIGKLGLAAAAMAVVIIALREKAVMHHIVERIGETEMRAALQFAVLALVVLPVLPQGPYGPFGGLRPRWLWSVVLILAALNFAAYLARRTLGADRGYMLTGLFGGLVSSTAVTIQFARASRDDPDTSVTRADGIVAASTVLLPRVVVIAAVLGAPLALALVPYIVPPLVVGAVLTWLAFRRAAAQDGDGATNGDGGNGNASATNPLAFGTALKMALFLQIAIMAITAAQEYFGSQGVVVSGALFGLVNLDALTVSMSRLAENADLASVAALGIGVGIVANTVFKFAAALALGAPAFRRAVAPRLLALGAASGAGLWLGTIL